MLNAVIMLGLLLNIAWGTARGMKRKDPGGYVVLSVSVIGIILLLAYMFS
jgi:hypothetical protein